MGLRLVMVTVVAFSGAVPAAGDAVAGPNSGGGSIRTAPPLPGGCGAPPGQTCDETGGGPAPAGQSGGRS